MQKIITAAYTIFIITLFVIATSAHAKILNSGPFNLPGGTVPPSGYLRLPLASLPFYTTYDITCDIENPNYNKPSPVVLHMYVGSLNGMTSSTKQYLLNQKISKYAARIFNDSRQGIGFTNYDLTDSVYVKNCIAVYATS